MSFRHTLGRAARRGAAPLLPVLGVAALVGVAACGETTSPASGTGRVTLLLTDAPGDFEKAVVTISEIYLQGQERVVLMDTPVTTDLLTLANTTAELVSDAVVPAGSYSELRFVITGGYVEVEQADGTTSIHASSPDYEGLPEGAKVDGTLQMPSFAQSGLKVKFAEGALDIAGERRIVLVDFDVSRSFGHQAGKSGKWVMHPVLTATEIATSGSLAVSLALADTVTLPAINDAATTLGAFRAVLKTADGGSEELALTDADGDGVFQGTYAFLLPGDYTIDFRAPSDSIQFTTAPGRPIPVTVGSGSDASVSATVTAATK
ncbi:MAG TPA: DUF4382 domain-containing protein [Gemmatimonadales bacterium]